jgi:hypothetical protein
MTHPRQRPPLSDKERDILEAKRLLEDNDYVVFRMMNGSHSASTKKTPFGLNQQSSAKLLFSLAPFGAITSFSSERNAVNKSSALTMKFFFHRGAHRRKKEVRAW